jgi:hypothetical protein
MHDISRSHPIEPCRTRNEGVDHAETISPRVSVCCAANTRLRWGNGPFLLAGIDREVVATHTAFRQISSVWQQKAAVWRFVIPTVRSSGMTWTFRTPISVAEGHASGCRITESGKPASIPIHSPFDPRRNATANRVRNIASDRMCREISRRQSAHVPSRHIRERCNFLLRKWISLLARRLL